MMEKERINILQTIEEAKSLASAARYKEAIAAYQRILAILDGSSHNQLKLESRIRSEIVTMLRNLGRLPDALREAERALQLDQILYESYKTSIADIFERAVNVGYENDKFEALNDLAASNLDLGLIYSEIRDLEKAKDYMDKSKELDDLQRNNERMKAFIAWRDIQRVAVDRELGYTEEAAKVCLEAVPVLLKTFSHDERLPIALSDAADILQDIGEYTIAESWLRKSLNLEVQWHGKSHPYVGIRYSNLATLLQEAGRHDEALKMQEEAIKIPKLERDLFQNGRKTYKKKIKDESKKIKSWASKSNSSLGRKIIYDFFISYNSKDEKIVNQLHDKLEKYGLDVWIFKEDKDWASEKTKEEILEKCKKRIYESRTLVVVCSGTSLTSLFVAAEIEAALALDIPVLAWYPEGTRIKPEKGAKESEAAPDHLIKVSEKLFDPGVYSYFGFGINRNLEDLTESLLFRLLLMSSDHPLRDKYNLIELSKSVRHPTKLIPVYVNSDGERTMKF